MAHVIVVQIADWFQGQFTQESVMRRKHLSVLAAMMFLVVGAVLAGQAEAGRRVSWTDVRTFPSVFPTDMTAFKRCGEVLYPDAQATLEIDQELGRTSIEIEVEDVRPNSFFTVWLLLTKPSPLTPGAGGGNGVRFTPLANISDIPDLAAVTPNPFLAGGLLDSAGEDADYPGSVDVVNGFFTDDEGEGEFESYLDFPVVNGSYPFDKFDQNLDPVSTRSAPAATLVVVSHCTDNVGHGLTNTSPNDPDEVWFRLIVDKNDGDDDDDDD